MSGKLLRTAWVLYSLCEKKQKKEIREEENTYARTHRHLLGSRSDEFCVKSNTTLKYVIDTLFFFVLFFYAVAALKAIQNDVNFYAFKLAINDVCVCD